ncbi:NADH dehydrogenase [ubiquinone] 1 beta subcomplex subunit 6 [Galemys pyrenaicus]|uniref:NADH dehydrogenase [ubiquinone] 1 beta subcomplex subunit 6 n=1 Tax=Galemys pyrenaicus TaxID=202257 RepID=A0A8J6DU65_GALPY|nr:NADH dehydrogenase [ubiquinone] 1 beta subcomplex subunit 6 [Galemys pyrenaicus]
MPRVLARSLCRTGARASDKSLGRGRAVSFCLGTSGGMSGYTPDEKLRLKQLRELRRKWLKDQELSSREPVLPPRKMWPMEAFWNNFLKDQAPWKNVIYKTYRHSIFAFTHVLIPAWIIHYYLKYHVNVSTLKSFLNLFLLLYKTTFYTKPYAIVERKPRIFPGDTILETGEVIPPMKEFPDQHH